jgi:molybdopterin molybdotransferase
MINDKSVLLDLDSARKLLADSIHSLAPVNVALEQAADLRLVQPVHADLDLPHWNVSAMDGYAVRAEDLDKGSLPVAFEVRAGDDPPPLLAGNACRIFTGAVVPAGADTVVPQEQATLQSDSRVVLDTLHSGSHIRYRGELLEKGAQIGAAQDLLTPGRIALLAAGGTARVTVIPRPRVAVVMTGSELVTPDQQPRRGSIRDSNGPLLRALIEKAHFSFAGRFSCADDLEETCRVLEQAGQQADLIVTSGGVSVGDFDFVPEAVHHLGGKILFHRLSLKPGKPALAARLKEAWLVGLPGNPVSVLACWRMFALPLGLALAGDSSLLREQPYRAQLNAPLENREDRTLLHPSTVTCDGDLVRLTPLPWKGSHDVAAAALADSFIRLEPGERAKANKNVNYYPLE